MGHSYDTFSNYQSHSNPKENTLPPIILWHSHFLILLPVGITQAQPSFSYNIPLRELNPIYFHLYFFKDLAKIY